MTSLSVHTSFVFSFSSVIDHEFHEPNLTFANQIELTATAEQSDPLLSFEAYLRFCLSFFFNLIMTFT